MTRAALDGVWGGKRHLVALAVGLLALLLATGPLTGCGGGYAKAGVSSASAEYDAFASADAAEQNESEMVLEESGVDAPASPGPMGAGALGVRAKTQPAQDRAHGGENDGAAQDALLIQETLPAEETNAEPSSSPRRPLLIYRAHLGLAVFQVQENLDAIETLARDAEGYLVQRGQRRIVVRVPAARFEGSVDTILKMGDVHRRDITAQDVTAEYTDLQIRLKNALAVRERLEALLQNAQDVKEALKVEEQLGRVTEQIEVMKGRLKLLRELTSFSTITVEFSERSSPIDSRVELPFAWLQELGLNSLLDL